MSAYAWAAWIGISYVYEQMFIRINNIGDNFGDFIISLMVYIVYFYH